MEGSADSARRCPPPLTPMPAPPHGPPPHHRAGFFGADCSLSLDAATRKPVLLAGRGYKERPSGPRIYV